MKWNRPPDSIQYYICISLQAYANSKFMNTSIIPVAISKQEGNLHSFASPGSKNTKFLYQLCQLLELKILGVCQLLVGILSKGKFNCPHDKLCNVEKCMFSLILNSLVFPTFKLFKFSIICTITISLEIMTTTGWSKRLVNLKLDRQCRLKFSFLQKNT